MYKIRNNKWVVGIGTAVIAGVILYFLFGQQVVSQFHYGNGDNVAGNKITQVSLATLPPRDLNAESKECILDQLNKLNGSNVSFQIFGSFQTVQNEYFSGMQGTPPDNETINFANSIKTFLTEKGFIVSPSYMSISVFDAEEPAFKGIKIKKGELEGEILVVIGPNDGRALICN